MKIDRDAEEWASLRTLLVACFNQDFVDIWGSPEDVVLTFARDAPAERRDAADAIATLLDGTTDDADTLRALEPLGRDYRPEVAGWSIRDWLAEVERVLRDPTPPTRLNERRGPSSRSRSTPMDIDPEAEEWAGLRTLLGAYFNQDFEDIHGSPKDTVRAFCRAATPEKVANAADGTRRILDRTAGEEDTLRAVGRFGLEYHPEAEGWQMRDWLTELERFLRNPDGPTRLNWPHEPTESPR